MTRRGTERRPIVFQMLVTGGVGAVPHAGHKSALPGPPSLSAEDAIIHRKHPWAGRAGATARPAINVSTAKKKWRENRGRVTYPVDTKPRSCPVMECAMMGTRGPY